MSDEFGTLLMESFWARTGFTPDFLPARYLKRAEFASAITKSDCSLGVTAMRSVTVTGGRDRFLLTKMAPPAREQTTTSVMAVLIFQFIVQPFSATLTLGARTIGAQQIDRIKMLRGPLTGDD